MCYYEAIDRRPFVVCPSLARAMLHTAALPELVYTVLGFLYIRNMLKVISSQRPGTF